MKVDTTTLIAFHEAGHAVCAVACGGDVRSVDIIPDALDRRLGICLPAGKLSPVDKLAYVFAGATAEAMYHVRESGNVARFRDHWGRDRTTAVSFPRRHVGNAGPAAEKIIAAGWQRAADVIGKHWPAVEHLAAQLLKRKRISGQSVRFIVDALPETPHQTHGDAR